jgi:hypothetical protein
MAMIYDNPDDAGRASKQKKAYCDPFFIHLPRGRIQVEIIKPLSGDPYAVYHTAHGIKVHDWKPGSADVDSIRKWHPWV